MRFKTQVKPVPARPRIMGDDRVFSTAYIGIGSNLGERHLYIEKSIQQITELEDTYLVNRAPIMETDPFEADGPRYLNTVIQIETALKPHDLLSSLNLIESNLGRVREYRNSPRTIDLDILIFGDSIIHDEMLHIPHPGIRHRDFVLVPLNEIASELIVPELDISVESLLKSLNSSIRNDDKASEQE